MERSTAADNIEEQINKGHEVEEIVNRRSDGNECDLNIGVLEALGRKRSSSSKTPRIPKFLLDQGTRILAETKKMERNMKSSEKAQFSESSKNYAVPTQLVKTEKAPAGSTGVKRIWNDELRPQETFSLMKIPKAPAATPGVKRRPPENPSRPLDTGNENVVQTPLETAESSSDEAHDKDFQKEALVGNGRQEESARPESLRVAKKHFCKFCGKEFDVLGYRLRHEYTHVSERWKGTKPSGHVNK